MVRKLITASVVATAFLVFAQAGSKHASQDFGRTLWKLWSSPTHPFAAMLFLSPCFIFVITTLVYYRFIVDYRGEIAGLSVAGLLVALYCCVQLLESTPDDWPAHLRWVYVLFFSYVCWDSLMLWYFLPRAENTELVMSDKDEIETITSLINRPTLGAILLMWIFAIHFSAEGVDATKIGDYVDGIVSFHLVFASCLSLFNMRLSSFVCEDSNTSTKLDTKPYVIPGKGGQEQASLGPKTPKP